MDRKDVDTMEGTPAVPSRYAQARYAITSLQDACNTQYCGPYTTHPLRTNKENVVAEALPPLLPSEPPAFYSPNSNPFANRPATRTPAGTAVLRRRSNLGLPPAPPQTPADPLRTSNTMLPPRPEQHLTRSLSGGAPSSGPRIKPPSPIMPPNLDAVSMAESSDAADWLSSPEITCLGSLHKTWNDIGSFVKDVPLCTPAPAGKAEGSDESSGELAVQLIGASRAVTEERQPASVTAHEPPVAAEPPVAPAQQRTPLAAPPAPHDAASVARPPRLHIVRDQASPAPSTCPATSEGTAAQPSAVRSTSWDARWGTSTTPYESLQPRVQQGDCDGRVDQGNDGHHGNTDEDQGNGPCLSATGTAVLQWADDATAETADSAAARGQPSATQHSTANAAALELRRRVAIGGTARLHAAAGTPRASIGDALAAAVRGVEPVPPPAPSPAPSPLPAGLAGLLAQVNPDSPLVEGRVLPLDATPTSRLRVEGAPAGPPARLEEATPISRLRVEAPEALEDARAQSAQEAASPARAASPSSGASHAPGASPSTPSVSVRTPPEAVFATGLCGGARLLEDDDEAFACTTSPRVTRWRRATEALARRASHYRPWLVAAARRALLHALLTAAVVVLYLPMWPWEEGVAIMGACLPGRPSSTFPYVVPPTVVLRRRPSPILGLPAPAPPSPVIRAQHWGWVVGIVGVGVVAATVWVLVLRSVLAAQEDAGEEQGGFVTPAARRVVYATPRTSRGVTSVARGGTAQRRAATSVRRSTRRRALDD